nr:MAG TPA: hypothetical protein [Caudoviricetes sp.]
MRCPMYPQSMAGCLPDMCEWWCKETSCCAVLAIAQNLRKIPRKTNCLMCENYRSRGMCAKGAAVCASSDMKRCCKYYHEKEVLDDE